MKRQGFTLVEVLLYIGISTTVLLIASLFMHTMFEAQQKNQALSEVAEEGAFLMRTITDAVRQADAVTTPSTGGTGSSLVLDMPSGGGNDPTVFSEASGVVSITEGAGAPIALTSGRVVVSSLTFSNVSRPSTPGAVRISFTVSFVNNTGRALYDVQKTFYGTASLR